MSSSKSSPTNTTATSTTLQTTNENVSGNSGLTNLGGNVNFSSSTNTSTTNNSTNIDASVHTTTDFGAIEAGSGLAQAALDTVAAANRSATDLAKSSESLIANIAGGAENSVGNAFGAALTSVQHNTDNTVSILQTLATQFGAALQTNFEDSQKQLGNVVSALNSTYTANNTSANQQVINAVSAAGAQSQAVVKYVALAAVAGVVLFLIVKSR